MSVYRLRVKCNNAQVEVIAKDGTVIAKELDKYLANFMGINTVTVEEPKEEISLRALAESSVQQQQKEEHFSSQVAPVNNGTPSLSEFIDSSNGYDDFSEFIIGAYYIKKVLGHEFFTLKTLNSKFYPATGNLVDFSMIEEARNRGFIDTIEDENGVRYCLNEQGEAFFVDQLRG